MKKAKVYAINAKTEYDLVNKINDSKLDIFATTPIQKNDGSWVAFVYYHPRDDEMQEKLSHTISTSKSNSSSPAFIPSPEQLERWKQSKPTKKTIDLLRKKGFIEEELRYIKTQFDAHQILENLKKENI